MKRSLRLSAAQLATLCVLGGLVTGSAYWLPTFFYPGFESIGYFRQIAVLIVLSVPGAIITGLSLKNLRRGVENQIWPTVDIDTLRANMDSHYWRAAYVVCGLACVAFLFGKHKFHLLGWGAYFSCSGLYALQNQLKYPNDIPGASLAITPPDAAPINSEHWGHN